MVQCDGMATMTIRTTFALDVSTESSIQRLAKLWNISKAEVVRRSVAAAEQTAITEAKPSPLEALNWLQSNSSLTESEAQKWATASKKGWQEAWLKKASQPRATKTTNTCNLGKIPRQKPAK